jgi:signal transduction histidine kinase
VTRWLPRSIAGRLLALSAVATLLALGVAALMIGGVLQRFVTEGVDRRLDGQIALMASVVQPDGQIDEERLKVASDTLAAERGWAWRIAAPGRSLGSAEFPRLDQGPPAPPAPPPPPGALTERPAPRDARPREGRDARDGRVHARERVLMTSGGTVTLTASAPARVIEQPIRDAIIPLLLVLAILSIVLALAGLLQVRFGLRPLRTLRDAVADVRAGHRADVPAEQPQELAPLAVELNALLRENESALTTARASAANLAHALKTPVATLALELRDDPVAAQQVARIDAVIRHHLSRSRDRVAGSRQSAAVAPALTDIAAMLGRLADGRVAIEITAADDLVAALDPTDFDELAGNLIDNAVRHAARRVHVAAVRSGANIMLTVEDDGPGIPFEARARAMQPGVRLDERGTGHGFGLAIVRELAELYGGSLSLAESTLGGLRAELSLAARALPPAD